MSITIKHDFQSDAHRLAIRITSGHRNNKKILNSLKKTDFSKKSETLVTLSARIPIVHVGLISRPSFCYTGFTELYVLLTG